jgi:hypothetical protein
VDVAGAEAGPVAAAADVAALLGAVLPAASLTGVAVGIFSPLVRVEKLLAC